MDIKDKVILITGGAKGIGLATANKFARDNKVIIIDCDAESCSKITNPNIKVYCEDITNSVTIYKIIDNIYNEFGKVDILINNAAHQTVNNISCLSVEEWQRVIDVNLTATFYITQYVSNKMHEGHTILNMISTHYNKPRTDKLHYDVSKAGVALLTQGFAMELSKKRVTINALAIGATYTPMNKDFETDINLVNSALNKIPLKYIATPEDIANHIYNIINNFSTSTTGSIFTIDGGRSLT